MPTGFQRNFRVQADSTEEGQDVAMARMRDALRAEGLDPDDYNLEVVEVEKIDEDNE
jgi:hypothetical protein